MFFGILTLITALTISAVAIYYSVAGLVAIFAAAAVPVIIMGSALEIGKLVTAVWLHRYWKQSVWWLKMYLSLAVVVLMFITSMGIFGFLSSAHIEQTASARESIARIEQIDQLILTEQRSITAAEQRIVQLESSGSSRDQQIQEQIDREQARIDSAYSRIQPAIDEQNRIIEREQSLIESRVEQLQAQLDTINQREAELDAALAANEIRAAQTIVGTNPDGDFGPGTERSIREFRAQQESARVQLTAQIDAIRNANNSAIENARTEIQRLRAIAESEINSSNELIARLRLQLGTVDLEEQTRLISEQRDLINQSRQRLEELNQQKFDLETAYRRLEAEVGPVKYLAEFIYGEEADRDLLEDAVRWVIVIIIFVFDPLAVLLLIASQYTFEISSKNKKKDKEKFLSEGDKLNELSRDLVVDTFDNSNNTMEEPRTTEQHVEQPVQRNEADLPMPIMSGAGPEGRSITEGLVDQQVPVEEPKKKVT